MLRDFRKVFKGSKGLTGSLMVVLSFGLLAYLGTAFQTTHPDSPEVVLARVYGRDIKRRDVNEAMQRMIQQYGKQENLEVLLPYIQQQAMGQLMNLKLTEELAERHGVVVTDVELRDALSAELRAIPFMLDAKGQLLPSPEIRNVLAQYFQVSLKTFEESIRSNLVTAKLRDQAAALVPVDEVWLDEENRARNEKIAFEFISLSPATITVPDPEDNVLEQYLAEHGDRFQQGPRRVLQIVTIDHSHFGDSLVPDEAMLKDDFETKKSSYLELHASHILIEAKTPEELEAANEKLLRIRARLVAGANFARVANAESEDPSAKHNNGDLGWFRDGTMDKGFWDGAVALKKGEISQPVKSAFGLHLIRLQDRKDRTFEEVKTELATERTNERFSALAKEKLEQLRKRVGEKGDLNAAAAILGLKAQLSEPFTSEAATIEGMEGVSRAAFEAFSMKVGQVSQVVSVPNRFIVYRVQKELPIAVPPLKEVRAKVLEAYRADVSRAELIAKFNGAEGRLSSLGPTQTKGPQTFAEMTEFSENPTARRTILETQVGNATKAVWTNDGNLWMARIKERTAAAPLSSEKRSELIKDIQSKESMKRLEAELQDLSHKGYMRRGFNSLWGRINGIYVNEAALKPRNPEYYDEY
jgi:peptidyl-prolyl cis-trans isomerase D